MKLVVEAESALNNMSYYIQKIKELTGKQFDQDMQDERLARKIEKDELIGKVRFDCLGLIDENCKHLEKHCSNIKACLNAISRQDK